MPRVSERETELVKTLAMTNTTLQLLEEGWQSSVQRTIEGYLESRTHWSPGFE